MEEVYEYIEAYFTQTLGGEERKAFEARCINDEAFANDVAFYIASRGAIRQELLLQKQQQWAAEGDGLAKVYTVQRPVKTIIQRVWRYAAAACVIVVSGIYFLVTPASSTQLARNYLQEKYAQLPLVMSPKPDTLQKAIEAYNNKDYTQALRLFELLQISHPDHGDEKKYAGLVYLFTQEYDQALEQFDALAKMDGLVTNPGNFLKAITLMERDAPGDKEQAKKLLQKVVNENTEGAAQAEKWLKKL
jgi:tetratricopeptide (TPR) repeat protein